MPTLGKRLGRRFVEARLAAGLTQEQVAERVGCSTETIGRLERGAQLPPLDRLDAAAIAVGVELADLLRDRRLGRQERAIARLVALLRRRPPEDAELAVALLERICQRFP